MMPATGRRHRVAIEQARDRTPNASGQLIPTWRTFADAYAEIQPLASSEKLRATELSANLTHRVRLNYIAGVDHTMRIRFGTRILSINSITNPNERNRSLELLCEELL